MITAPPRGKGNFQSEQEWRAVIPAHVVPRPQELRCCWFPVVSLSGDPFEMGCWLWRGKKENAYHILDV